MDKKSKVILITGASSGIGFDAARRLAGQGHRVYAAARRVELMEPLKADSVEVMRLDVTDDESMSQCVNAILEREGRVDVLVNNAGYGYFGAVENVTMAEARRQLEVNVFGLARLCQLVLPAMRRQGSGRIVNISSISATVPSVSRGEYCISKAGVSMATRLWAVRLAEFGIPVYEIRPGVIKTDMTAAVEAKYDKLLSEELCLQPRWGFPEDIGRAVAMLLRGDLAYSTGQVINVEGGMGIQKL